MNNFADIQKWLREVAADWGSARAAWEYIGEWQTKKLLSVLHNCPVVSIQVGWSRGGNDE
jgi:hypothetical protein